MALGIIAFLQQMLRDGEFRRIAGNMLAQFGTPRRSYLGATLLPERLVTRNAYREDSIQYRTVIANDGTRYSPAQKKSGNNLIGSMLVELGDQDIATEFTGEAYDTLLEFLNSNQSMEAVAEVLNWVDTNVNLALVEAIERQRWQAIENAQVIRQGDNGYSETINYPDPAGHRVNVAGDWNSDAYDLWDDILAGAQVLWGKGYQVSRIISSRRVTGIMAANDYTARRTGRLTVVGNNITIENGRTTLAGINAALAAEGLPDIETYDLSYHTQTSSARFMSDDVFILVAQTGRDVSIETTVGDRLVTDTLGYSAVGRATGQATPGRVIEVAAHSNKPPRLTAEGWQTTLPVITDPEAIVVLKEVGN